MAQYEHMMPQLPALTGSGSLRSQAEVFPSPAVCYPIRWRYKELYTKHESWPTVPHKALFPQYYSTTSNTSFIQNPAASVIFSPVPTMGMAFLWKPIKLSYSCNIKLRSCLQTQINSLSGPWAIACNLIAQHSPLGIVEQIVNNTEYVKPMQHLLEHAPAKPKTKQNTLVKTKVDYLS